MVRIGKGIAGEHYGKSLPRLEFLPLDMTIIQLKKFIYTKIRNVYKEDHPIHKLDPEELNRCILLHVVDNLPIVSEKFSKRKAMCEFCKGSHGQADTCDLKINKVSANSIEGSEEIKVRDILENMEHRRDLIIGVIFREGSGAQMKYLDPDFDQSHIRD